jgi:hypothetical protein
VDWTSSQSGVPQNNKIQTRRGQDGASLLILVLGGPHRHG